MTMDFFLKKEKENEKPEELGYSRHTIYRYG
jgi:hypothetical protein